MAKAKQYQNTPTDRDYHSEFVSQHLQVSSKSGDEWSVLCPLHGDKNASMRVNVLKGVFYCHGCHVRGTLSSLAYRLKLPFRRSHDPERETAVLMAKLGVLSNQARKPASFDFWQESRLDRYRSVPTPWWTDLPPSGCGFTPETIEMFGLGYDPLEEQAIIPVRDIDGRLLGVTRRNLARDSQIKYKDPKRFNKSANLFASWLLPHITSHYVVLVEGPKDCMKVWQSGHPSVAQYGSYVTPEQVRVLRTLGITTIVTMYDNDAGGRLSWRAAKGAIVSLSQDGRQVFHRYDPSRDLRRFFVVKRAQWSGKYKDPGETPEKMIDKMVRGAQYIG